MYYVRPLSDCIVPIFQAGFRIIYFLYIFFLILSFYLATIIFHSWLKWLKSCKLCVFSRPPERKSIYLNHSPERESCHVPPSPTVPVCVTPQSPLGLQTSSTPALKPGTHSYQDNASVRKRRRLAASPGGLHWNASGTVCHIEMWHRCIEKCIFPIRALLLFIVSLLFRWISLVILLVQRYKLLPKVPYYII